MLGDQLTQPREKESVFQFYNSNKIALAESLVHCNKKMNLFIQRIEQINQGWIEVLPFLMKNLIFLKGEMAITISFLKINVMKNSNIKFMSRT